MPCPPFHEAREWRSCVESVINSIVDNKRCPAEVGLVFDDDEEEEDDEEWDEEDYDDEDEESD